LHDEGVAPQALFLTAEVAEKARRSQRLRALCVLCAFSAASAVKSDARGVNLIAG
jgi:hypothetical protein